MGNCRTIFERAIVEPAILGEFAIVEPAILGKCGGQFLNDRRTGNPRTGNCRTGNCWQTGDRRRTGNCWQSLANGQSSNNCPSEIVEPKIVKPAIVGEFAIVEPAIVGKCGGQSLNDRRTGKRGTGNPW